MKKLLALSFAALVILVGCNQNKNGPNTIKDGKAIEDVILAVDSKFKETYGDEITAVAMAAPIDEQYLSDYCGINPSDISDFSGSVSMSMTNSDAFFGVKAKDKKVDEIKALLDKRLEDITATFEQYPVSGSYDRAKSGEVYQKGDYVFLIVVGYLDDKGESADFSGDVSMAKQVIDSMFNS